MSDEETEVLEVKRKRPRISSCPQIRSNPSVRRMKWSVSEMKSLAYALEKYGFGNISKITAEVGTRSEAEVKFFIEKYAYKVYLEKYSRVSNEVSLHKLFSQKTGISYVRDTKELPPIAVWKKGVSNMIPYRYRQNDYSAILHELFECFAEEESPYVYKDLPNFQELYRYLASTLSGDVPPVPSAANNLILNYLYHDVKNFMDSHDLSNEEEFFRKFRGPHRFMPLRVKEEVVVKQEVMDDYETNTTVANNIENSQVSEAGPSGYTPIVDNQPNGIINTAIDSQNDAASLLGHDSVNDVASLPSHDSQSDTASLRGHYIQNDTESLLSRDSSNNAACVPDYYIQNDTASLSSCGSPNDSASLPGCGIQNGAASSLGRDSQNYEASSSGLATGSVPSNSAGCVSSPHPSGSSNGAAINGSVTDCFNAHVKTEDASFEDTGEQNDTPEKKFDVMVKHEFPSYYSSDYACIPRGPTIDVPGHLFDVYKLHEKVKENLNPMIVPVWMQQAEQKAIKSYFDALE